MLPWYPRFAAGIAPCRADGNSEIDRAVRGVPKGGMGTGGPGAARAMLGSNEAEEWRIDSDFSRCCLISINPRAWSRDSSLDQTLGYSPY